MKRFGVMLAALIAAALLAAIGFVSFITFVPAERFSKPRTVSVETGDSLRHVASKLQATGVIRSRIALIALAELTGHGRHIMPGDYEFNGGESPLYILNELTTGPFNQVIVTIPEGLTVRQIAARLEQAGLVCQPDFERAARHGRLVEALGLGSLGMEGFLFPATYSFSPHAGENRILATMLERFYAILTPTVEQRMFVLGLDTRRLVTLASIVEKEAAVPGERPLIASVFYNRLRIGMPLQSDPTAQYNLNGASEPAAVAVHKRSAFNTYDFVGLPPGPIANPGMSSIEATLYPAKTNYLYFVARGDGTHIFSENLREHERAIASLHESRLRQAASSHPRR